MTNKFYINILPKSIIFLVVLLCTISNIHAQIKHPIQLNYGGTELKGSVDISIQIIDKAPDSRNKALQFSNKKIKADVSKFEKPTLIFEISNLKFRAPKNLLAKLALDVSQPSLPKGFDQNTLVAIQPPLKVNEKRVFNYEIVASDTILVGEVKFRFNFIQIGKRKFQLKDSFQAFLNITPPPLFPPDTTEKELWKIASKLKTVQAFDVYIERFPKGQSIQKAKRQRKILIDQPKVDYTYTGETSTNNPIFITDENKTWKNAKKANKIDTYKAYLKNFPQGKHAKEAVKIVRSLSDSLDGKIIKSAQEELLGRLIYHIQDTMTIGHTYRVRLEISSDTTTHFIEKLIADVEEYSNNPQDLSSEIIEIGKTMHAHLEDSAPEDDKNFYIHLFGESSEREVDLYSSKATIWEWDVRPLKEGQHPLYFTIEIITKKDGVEKEEVLPVYDSKITILSLSVFQTYKIEFISGAIISALLVIILALFFRKKKASKKELDLEKLVKMNPLEGAIVLVEHDKVREALNALDQFLSDKDPEILQEIILLKSRLASNENNLNKATISQEAAANERNSIKLTTLDIIERARVIR